MRRRSFEWNWWRALPGLHPEVCIRPGHATAWVFDSPLLSEQVELDGRERFLVVEPGRHGLLLVPPAELRVGERLKLSVRFADGLPPESADFILVVHPSRSIRQVNVSRRPGTGDPLRNELKRLEKENERLRGELSRSGSVAGIHSTGVLDERGISVHSLYRRATVRPTSSGLEGGKLFAQRSARRVVVLVEVKNLDPLRPWMARNAKLASGSGEELKVLAVSQAGPIPPGDKRRLVIEAEAATNEARGTYTLTVLEADGLRSLTVEGVTFPALMTQP